MNHDKALKLLGLALRAGKLVHGDEAVEKAVKRDKVACIILAKDISQATFSRYQRLCQVHHVPCINNFTRDELSHALNKSRSILGITDRGMSAKFLSYQTGEERL